MRGWQRVIYVDLLKRTHTNRAPDHQARSELLRSDYLFDISRRGSRKGSKNSLPEHSTLLQMHWNGMFRPRNVYSAQAFTCNFCYAIHMPSVICCRVAEGIDCRRRRDARTSVAVIAIPVE